MLRDAVVQVRARESAGGHSQVAAQGARTSRWTSGFFFQQYIDTFKYIDLKGISHELTFTNVQMKMGML